MSCSVSLLSYQPQLRMFIAIVISLVTGLPLRLLRYHVVSPSHGDLVCGYLSVGSVPSHTPSGHSWADVKVGQPKAQVVGLGVS